MLLFLFSWQSHQWRGHWCRGQWRGIRAWRFRLPWRSLSPRKLSMTVPGILLPHLYPGCSAGDASCSCRPGLLLGPCWLSSRPRRSRPTSSSSTQVEAWRWRWQTTWRRRWRRQTTGRWRGRGRTTWTSTKEEEKGGRWQVPSRLPAPASEKTKLLEN